MKDTLNRKIKEFKEQVFNGDIEKDLELINEIQVLANILGCSKEIAHDIRVFLDAKGDKLSGKKQVKLDVYKSEYNDVIHLRVHDKMNINQILALIEDVRPDYSERYHDIGIALNEDEKASIIIEYKGRKDIVIEPDLSGMSDLELATLCMQIDAFLD